MTSEIFNLIADDITSGPESADGFRASNVVPGSIEKKSSEHREVPSYGDAEPKW